LGGGGGDGGGGEGGGDGGGSGDGDDDDIAALVFRRFNVSESGELSLQELQALQVLSRTRP